MVVQNPSSILLDLAAADDLEAFKTAVESSRLPINLPGLWYGPKPGSRKMGYEERTPLMIAALYNSTKILNYILNSTPADPTTPKPNPPLPDINTGVYSSDEFRMYSFKIKPCSRAYTHDWTECPFAHPGENARRRDPVRHQYSCVPCPEFKKGSCRKNDDCEFAHGVFESWLHPAQYRTRLCKDEIGCGRKVCFFAHKKEELRPVYASTGSAIPSDPISPSGSPKWGSSATGLQLPGGSRLRSSSSARDVDFEIELLKNEIAKQNQMKLKPANLESMFGMVNSLDSPNRVRSSYPVSPKSMAAAMMKSRAAFANRSQSFVDRGAGVGNWGLGERKVDWSVQGDDLSKMRRTASFGIRGSENVNLNGGRRFGSGGTRVEEPDVSWVSSLVAPTWVDQVCM